VDNGCDIRDGADLPRMPVLPNPQLLLRLSSFLTTQRGEASDVRFRCERDVLAEALGVAGRAATTRNDPLLSNLRLQLQGDQLSVTGTDDELTIHAEVVVAGETDGVLVAPARLTTDIVRSLEPGAVDVVAEGDEAHISSGRSQFTVRTRAPEDFPRVAVPTTNGVRLPGSLFGDAVRQVVGAASREANRPVLTGVLLSAEEEGLRLVATDSYRLAMRDLPGTSVLETGQQVLVPSRAFSELVRVLQPSSEVAVGFGERDAAFDTGSVQLATRLIEGQFPAYRQLVPAGYPNHVTVGREPLLDAIRRTKLLLPAGGSSSSSIRLSIRSGEVELSSTDSDRGNAVESLDAKLEGNELAIAFNPEFLADGVEAVVGDEVVIETLDAMKPALIRSTEQAGYLYLLMPVRLP
jgi:DNA polymerase-3 subunit beta